MGVFGEAIAYVEGDSLTAAFAVGSIAFGWPPILAGLGLLIGAAFRDVVTGNRVERP